MTTSITQEKSAAIAAAEELVAAALRLRALPVPVEEWQKLLGLMANAAEALAATANGMGSVVYEAAPAGGTIGEPDGWLPPAGQLIQELDRAFDGAIWQRNALQKAATIVEDMAQDAARKAAVESSAEVEPTTRIIDGRQALIDSGDLPGPDGAYLSTTQRAALAQLKATLAERHGVTR